MTTRGNNTGAQATLRPAFEQFLPRWLARQRWYTGKGHTPQMTRVGGLRWQDPRGVVGIETHFVLDSGGVEPVLYHVPLTFRGEPLPQHLTGPDALVVTAEHSELGTRWIYDACHDPRYAQVLLDSLTGAGPLPEVLWSSPAEAGAAEQAEGRMAFAEPAPGATRIQVRSARVLRGEQSNTSIIINDGEPGPAAGTDRGQESTTGTDSSDKVIVKVFRVLRPGANPEAEVLAALADVDSTAVPAPVGALGAAWRAGPASGHDEDAAEGVLDGGHGSVARFLELGTGHLAFASEFLPGARDAWDMALAAAEAKTDVSGAAFSLGETTARLHHDLREAFPHPGSDRIRVDLPADVRARFADARADVPDLARYADDLEQLIEQALAETPWPPVQRVHGDFHLGQVLHAPGRGWVVVDFEGEPLRPIAERAAPTLALRDVAGMLRSFDYAGAGTGEDRRWVNAARRAFLDGYSAAGGTDTGSHAALLRLLELDKACYEARYEARNRPAWLPIPLAAITRLIEEPQ